MHDRGYNFFTMNKLTYPEINLLINAFNHREADKLKAQKKANKKGNTKKW